MKLDHEQFRAIAEPIRRAIHERLTTERVTQQETQSCLRVLGELDIVGARFIEQSCRAFWNPNTQI